MSLAGPAGLRSVPTLAPRIEPDLAFKRKVQSLGAGDLSACYQCGTCSVVCPISTADNPFPRKEMIWAQWGLRDRALGNSSIWLCHECGVCTAYCPRDAKPASVMAALRDYSITHYAVPGFMARAMSDAKYLPLLLALPALIFLVALASLGNLAALPEGEIVYTKFVPTLYIELIFNAAAALSVAGGAAGGVRYWRAMRRQMGGNRTFHWSALLPTLRAILRHKGFGECEERPAGTRKTYKGHLYRSHLAAFYGFVGLGVTTASVAIGIYVFGYLTPWPLWHPVKILGNVSGLALLAAIAVLVYRRIADAESAGKSTYSDWLFLQLLLLTTLTGYLTELFRLAELPGPAYPTYFVHLVFVFVLIVYIPYSKFAHVVYRSVAMLYAANAAEGSAGRAMVTSNTMRA